MYTLNIFWTQDIDTIIKTITEAVNISEVRNITIKPIDGTSALLVIMEWKQLSTSYLHTLAIEEYISTVIEVTERKRKYMSELNTIHSQDNHKRWLNAIDKQTRALTKLYEILGD